MQYSTSGFEFWANRVEQELNAISGYPHIAKRLVKINSEKLRDFHNLDYKPTIAANMLFVLNKATHFEGAAAA